MKKMRVLSGMLGTIVILAVLCTGVIGASASTVTVTTSTAYNMVDPSLVTVTSKISGVGANEQITYLAYNNDMDGEPYADGTGTNIIFVEQLESVQETETATYSREFVYTTKVSNIDSTIVKFGAEKTTVSDVVGNDDNPDIFVHGVTITADGGVVKLYVKGPGENDWVVPTDTTTIIQGDVMLELIPNSGNEVGTLTVTVGGIATEVTPVPKSDDKAECIINSVNGDLVVNATFKEKDSTSEPLISDASNFGGTGGTSLEGSEKTAVAFSQITVPTSITENEYGVLLYFDSSYNDEIIWGDVIDSQKSPITERSGIYKFKALARTDDGKYAVKLIDNRTENNVLGSGGFYLRPYLSYTQGEETTVLYGEDQDY